MTQVGVPFLLSAAKRGDIGLALYLANWHFPSPPPPKPTEHAELPTHAWKNFVVFVNFSKFPSDLPPPPPRCKKLDLSLLPDSEFSDHKTPWCKWRAAVFLL